MHKAIISIISIITFCIICSGCPTTRYIVDDSSRAVIREFAELEAEFRNVEQRIERAQEIGTNIEDEIDRTIYLFRQYDSIVFDMLSEIDRYRKLIEKYEIETY